MSEQGDQGFILLETINMEVEEDIAGAFSDFVELSHRCQWVAAQQMYDEYLEVHDRWFPVAAEYADFLLRQGKYRTLYTYCGPSSGHFGNDKDDPYEYGSMRADPTSISPSLQPPLPYSNPEHTLFVLIKSICQLHLEIPSEPLDWKEYLPPLSELPAWGRTESTVSIKDSL